MRVIMKLTHKECAILSTHLQHYESRLPGVFQGPRETALSQLLLLLGPSEDTKNNYILADTSPELWVALSGLIPNSDL